MMGINKMNLDAYKKLCKTKFFINREFLEVNEGLIGEKLSQLGGINELRTLFNKNVEEMTAIEKKQILRNFKVINNSLFMLELLKNKSLDGGFYLH